LILFGHAPLHTKPDGADLGKQTGIFKRVPPRKIPDSG